MAFGAIAEMKRRHFLGRVGWALAALGIGETGWWQLSARHYQVLAQSTPRKLAFLVGINQYPNTQALSGCLTDVELQRELLIHRFGFKASDILTLTEQQATRQQIETAFLEHLTKQARAGDVVVFHFSGYGRHVRLPEASERSEESTPLTSNSLVPVDGVGQTSDSVANDLLEETLWLMLRSLPTDRVTTILDTSFNPPSAPLQGSLRSRSYPQEILGQPSEAELAFQQQLQQRLCQGEFNKPYCGSIDSLVKATSTPMPGIVLAAAGSTQLATETQWAGFDAGLFTYILTQYLWEATPEATIQVSLSRVTAMVEQLVGREQQPQMSSQKSQHRSLLAYYLLPEVNLGADGVAIAVEEDGKTAQLWLAGIPPTVLEYYGVHSRLNVLTPNMRGKQPEAGKENLSPSPSPLQLQVRSRKGLTAKAQIINSEAIGSLQVGQLVREAVRVLPRNINLTIALEPKLERIERVDATSAFAGIPHVSTVVAGEQPADYLFGRVQEVAANGDSTPGGYGLFSLGQELVPNTAGIAGEAIKAAVRRLTPQLHTLLAAKLWRVTANEGSSQLQVKATLELVNATEQALMQRETLRSPLLSLGRFINPNSERTANLIQPVSAVPAGLVDIRLIKQVIRSNSLFPSEPAIGVPTLPIGSRIQYRLHNYGDRPLYVLLLGLDSSKNSIALYPSAVASDGNELQRQQLEDIAIAPGDTLTLPRAGTDAEWVIQGPAGLAETQLIFSRTRFTQTLATIAAAMQPKGKQGPIGSLFNPLEVAQALLQDLHYASAIASGSVTESISSTDNYTLDVNAWASLSFIYQIA